MAAGRATGRTADEPMMKITLGVRSLVGFIVAVMKVDLWDVCRAAK